MQSHEQRPDVMPGCWEERHEGLHRTGGISNYASSVFCNLYPPMADPYDLLVEMSNAFLRKIQLNSFLV